LFTPKVVAKGTQEQRKLHIPKKGFLSFVGRHTLLEFARSTQEKRHLTSNGCLLKLPITWATQPIGVPVAQLDRALVSGTKGHRFDSCRERHFPFFLQIRKKLYNCFIFSTFNIIPT
jgi:hypothetical protein